jgi:phage baseplate assembly protein W
MEFAVYSLEKFNAQNDSYLGKGWSFPLRPSVQGGIQLTEAARKIRESIWIILRTKLGERVYRPTFGSRLADLQFAPLNNNTLLLIRIYVQEALEAWEPRILLDEVLTDPDPVRGKVDIHIQYRLKNYSDSFNCVYPFYLTAAE